MTQQELVANSAEESPDLSLRGSITHRGVAKENTEAGADLVDLGAGVDGAVVDVERLWDAALVECAA